MKVKWTTITEDESTWPPYEKLFLIESEDGYYSYQVKLKETIFGPKASELSGNRPKYLEDCFYVEFESYYGRRWRPMPKPPKKGCNRNENEIKLSKWTTITENRSTWPPNDEYFIVTRYIKAWDKIVVMPSERNPLGDELIIGIINGNSIKISEFIGEQWMHIPELPKKSKVQT